MIACSSFSVGVVCCFCCAFVVGVLRVVVCVSSLRWLSVDWLLLIWTLVMLGFGCAACSVSDSCFWFCFCVVVFILVCLLVGCRLDLVWVF